ncbi:phage holin family protein [Staphylococcus felis]|uniref:Phage holin family protein n=1 Tax=Staphylococcus felis TaxID=46127 RepID=A0ABS0QL00_9STAP|nr:phage holin family protein [Staphylococcus felis]MBH9579791.1 phage holin family protein [Staphylococcus felis]REH78435.1 holin [Staphylococcus felis]REH96415.1 holin [Staphylococcus felis]REI16743.1 holin [Staphylococcus felis]REI31447.1 holin [Staphylococcus felis]
MIVHVTETEAFRTFIYAGEMKLLYFLMVLMAIDVITGLAKAVKNKKLWSRKSLFGYARKMLIFCIIILANVIDQIIGVNGGIVMVTIFFYIANEGLSIVENCAEMGVLIPKEIAEKLAVIKNENGTSVTTEIKEEFTSTHSRELEGDVAEVKIKVEKD